jgi:hypothetical protein
MYRIRSSRTIPLLEAQGGSGRQAGGPTRKGRQEGPSIDTPISKRITNSGAAWHCAEAGHFRQAEHTDPEGRRRRRIDFRPDWVDSARMRGVRGLLRASPSHFGLFSSHYGRVTGKLRMILNCANSPHVLIQLSQLAQEPGLARLVTANVRFLSGLPRHDTGGVSQDCWPGQFR